MTISYGETTASVSGGYDQLSAAKRKDQLNQFVQWLNQVGKFEQYSEQDIGQHFAPSFKYYTNGKLAAVDSKSLYSRYLLAKQKYKMAYIHFPVKDIVMDGSQVAATYEVTFVDKQGKERHTNNLIILKFNSAGRVEEFSQSFDAGDPISS